MNDIFIMQGRLLKDKRLPLQSFPYSTWQDEFKLCKKIGFTGIEWLLDEVNISRNPLLNETEKILDLINKYKISIQTICLHFLLDDNIKNIEEYFKILNTNFSSFSLTCQRIGIKNFVLPINDKILFTKNKFIKYFNNFFLNHVEGNNFTISIENDFSSKENLKFLQNLKLKNVKLTFDTGNLTIMNYDLKEYIKQCFDYINEIHIKDKRIYDGQTVKLGTGNTNFLLISNLLLKHNWSGYCVLETPMLKNSLEAARYNLNYIKKFSIWNN